MWGIPVLYPVRKTIAGGGAFLGGGGRGLYRTRFRKLYTKEIPWKEILKEEEPPSEPEEAEAEAPLKIKEVRSFDDFTPAINESEERLRELLKLMLDVVKLQDEALRAKVDMEALSAAIRLENIRLAMLLEDEAICLIALV